MIPPTLIAAGVVGVIIIGQGFAIKHYHGELVSEERAHEADLAAAKAAADAQKAHNAEVKQRDIETNAIVEKKNAEITARLAAGWDAERAQRVRADAEIVRAGSAPRSPFTTGLSVDAAVNSAISAAFSGYVTGARQAFAECADGARQFRADVAQQLSEADRNTATLILLQQWATDQAKIK